MVISLRVWFKRLLLLAGVAMVAWLLAWSISWMSDWIQPPYRYQEPMGEAVRVFGQAQTVRPQHSLLDRLRLFYWIGE